MKSNKSNEGNSRISRSIKRKNMMNIVMITIGAIIIMAFIGTGVYNSSASHNNSELSPDAIKQVVADQYPGTITEMEMKQEYNKVIYEVEVVNEEKKYDLQLDGDTGEVIKLEESNSTNEEKVEEAKDDKKQSDIEHNEDNDHDQSNIKIDEKHHDKSKYKNKQKKNNSDQIAIDAKEAIDIALNEYLGLVTELELDRNNGRLYYEIEIRSGNEEAEIEIDAHTGEILVIEIDD